jgi:coenzyme A diphosphatase NUDT7
VHSLFSHPLRGFLSSDSPFPPDPADAGPAGSATYHTVTDIAWAGDPTGARRVRMHRFLTGREEGGTKPVYGLTAYVPVRSRIPLRIPLVESVGR